MPDNDFRAPDGGITNLEQPSRLNRLSHGTWGLSERPDLTGWSSVSLLALRGQPVTYTDLSSGRPRTFRNAFSRFRGFSDSDTSRLPLYPPESLLPCVDDTAANHRTLERVRRFVEFERELDARVLERGRDIQASRDARAFTQSDEERAMELMRRNSWPEARTITEAFRNTDMALTQEERDHWQAEVQRLWDEERAGRVR
jgi:hypothetical protein